jgi:medium-chain acyl-[acyl-carrier-protein] hydrolase
MTRKSSPWLYYPQPNKDAALRLFCFPHAAGLASFYSTWPDVLPASIEVCAFEISDRERHLSEANTLSIAVICETIAREIEGLLDKPFAFFGHCIGSLLAFETTHAIHKLYNKLPTRLFLASMIAPSRISHLKSEVDHYLDCSLEELLDFVIPDGNEMKAIILEDPVFIQSFGPLLKRDVQTLYGYQYPGYDPLPCPFSIFGGHDDHLISYNELLAWKSETSSNCTCQIFPGDHLFLHAGKEELLKAMCEHLIQELMVLA